MTRWLLIVMGIALAVAACTTMPTNQLSTRRSTSDNGANTSNAPATIDAPTIPADVQLPLKNATDAHADLCASGPDHPSFPDDADQITKSFCQDTKPNGVMPTPGSLNDLLKQLNLDFKDPNGGNGVGGNPGFAFLGHSSALTARKISTIMPTVFIFTPPPADGSKPTTQYSILGFDPGEQFVEVASYDPTGDTMNFYVVFFEQACNKQPGGCTNADLLTNKLTQGWSNVRVYEDTTELDNTIFDCHVCHQPNDKGQPFLRMQEIEAPFTHWFSSDTEGGKALLEDFHKAHNGDYGGVPAQLVDKSDPSKLAQLIKQAGFGDQPNVFPSATIEAELKASAPGQPAVNVPMGASTTWQALYDNAVAGQFIATPYHDVKITDPVKLTSMTKAYNQFLAGTLTDLPDIREVFLDDALRDMGFAPKAGIDGKQILQQMCQECHNANLDMTLTRENFLVDKLDTMSRAEKDLAIERINTELTSRLTMPPTLFRTVTAGERQLMIDELRK